MVGNWWSRLFSFLSGRSRHIIQEGYAARVVFFYPGEEGSYVDGVYVTLFTNGIVHLRCRTEETTVHLQNCEVLWRFETEADEQQRSSKLRLLKPKKGDQPPRGPEPEPPTRSH